MTRSRSINRFHRFVARKRRHGLRAAVPHLRPDRIETEEKRDVSGRLFARSNQLELRQELEALND